MSLEALGYAQAALGIYLLVLCIYLFYDYYRNAYVLSSKPKGPYSNIILYLFIALTIFTILLSFFIAFLYNNGFNMVTDETVLNSLYCLRIHNTNIWWFYFHSIIIFLIISYIIQRALRNESNNSSNYSFNSNLYLYYRIIIIVLNIYCAIHICAFLHIAPSGNISTNVEWNNIETGKAFVLCELHAKDKGRFEVHTVLLIIFEITCYILTAVPLLMRYKWILTDHKNKDKPDNNEEIVTVIQSIFFYMLISIVFEIILFPIFVHEPRISGFILSLLLIIRTTCIYCVFKETVSSTTIYVFLIYSFNWIWNKISPLNDPQPVDPNYRWFHKNKAPQNDTSPKQKKHKSKSPALSSVDEITRAYIVATENEDIEEEFNDENSVVFSKSKGASSVDDYTETDTLK